MVKCMGRVGRATESPRGDKAPDAGSIASAISEWSLPTIPRPVAALLHPA